MKLTVTIDKVYGNEIIRPMDETAKGFCRLLKQKTLTRGNIADIQRLGYSVVTNVHGVNVTGLFDKE